MRLEISEFEISRMPDEYRISDLGNHYFARLLKHANRIGLEGKEIESVFCIDDYMRTMRVFDFVVKSKLEEK